MGTRLVDARVGGLGLLRGLVLDVAGSRWAWLGLASVWLEADGIAERCDLLGA